MHTIENQYLKITVDFQGGVPRSIYDKKNNYELEYQIVKDSWQSQDVVIFPRPGDNIFRYDGKIYENPTRHGILRNALFFPENLMSQTMTLRYQSNYETKKYYPFEFIFRLTYTLDKNALREDIEIENLNKKVPMPLSYGSHLALRTIEKGYIDLNGNTNLYPLKKGLIDLENPIVLDNELSLSKDTFKKYDTLVFKNENHKLYLYNGENYKMTYEFNAPNFAIWSNANTGDYVCIEPWWGLSNSVKEPLDLLKKPFIYLVSNKIKFSFKITFDKE